MIASQKTVIVKRRRNKISKGVYALAEFFSETYGISRVEIENKRAVKRSIKDYLLVQLVNEAEKTSLSREDAMERLLVRVIQLETKTNAILRAFGGGDRQLHPTNATAGAGVMKEVKLVNDLRLLTIGEFLDATQVVDK